jgi:hypothetical protein
MTSGVWKKALERACEKYERYISNDLDIEQVARLHGMVAMSEMVDPTEITERKVLDYLAALQLHSLGLTDEEVSTARQAYNEIHQDGVL